MLEDIVVLDLTQVLAGPLACRLFAELGATVIKVEGPGGDSSRQLVWRVDGRSGYFVQQNRGKLGVGIDLKTAEGKAALWRLIERADVLIDGYAQGVLERLGFAYGEMATRNESLILCELSALGRDGPLGHVRGYDQIGACMSGVAYTTASGDQPPGMPNVAMGDAMMALCAYGGIMSALYERTRTGKGQRVSASIVDSYIQAHSSNIEGYSLSGGEYDPRPINGQNASVCPGGPFPAVDGRWLYIVTYSNEQWARLSVAMGKEELANDPRYNSSEARIARRAEVLGIVQEYLDTFPDRDAAVEALQRAGVSAAPVLSIGEVIAHPHLRERGTVEFVNDDVLGEFAVPGPPFRLSRTGRVALGPAPHLGEHNEQVLAKYAGMTSDEIESALESGALFAENRASS